MFLPVSSKHSSSELPTLFEMSDPSEVVFCHDQGAAVVWFVRTCGALSGQLWTAVSARKLGFSKICRITPQCGGWSSVWAAIAAVSERKLSFSETYWIMLQCVWMVTLRLSSDIFNTCVRVLGFPDTYSIMLQCVVHFISNIAHHIHNDGTKKVSQSRHGS